MQARTFLSGWLTLLACAGALSSKNYYEESLGALRARLEKTLGADRAAGIQIPFELDDEIVAAANDAARGAGQQTDRIQALLDLMTDKKKLDLKYDPAVTETAREVFRIRTGNCLSLTNLFVGMARVSSINVRYAHVTEIERYAPSGGSPGEGVIVHSSHICGVISEAGRVRLIDFSPRGTRQYHSYRIIDDVEALAHFYNNKGYEAGYRSAGADPAARLEREIALYETAIVVDPDFSYAYNNLGTTYKRIGELKKALDYYAKALELDPRFAEAYSNRAAIFFQEGKAAQAIDELNKALKFSPTNPYLRYDLGNLYYGYRRYKEAEDCYKRAVALDPRPAFYTALARSRIAQGKRKEALESVMKALERDPTYAEAKSLLASLQVKP
ncbi:MAG: tetratricopeptide repeat protein [Acidobacteriota bacterium]